MPQQSSNIPDMSAILGRALTLGEERTVWHGFEERFAIDTEAARLKNEQQKLLHEGEKLKQSLLARAIESMTPGWERGGQRVDVGQFQGRDVAVGPGPIGGEITPATGPGVQYRQPGAEQQRMGQRLVEKELGLTEDPVVVFDRQMAKMEAQEEIRGKREDARDVAREKREEARETKRTAREETGQAARAALETQKEAGKYARDLEDKMHGSLDKAMNAYTTIRKEKERDPQFKLLPLIEQKSVLQALDEEYKDWIGAITRRYQGTAKRYGLKVEIPEDYKAIVDPSVMSQEQIARYKGLSKSEKRIFDKAYEDRFGKPHGLGKK
jgi:hypothetical protein